MHFSYDLEDSLTPEENKANLILQRLIGHLKSDTYNAVIHDYFENFVNRISQRY
jgi:uncharacterized membrane protein YgcG